MKRIFAYRGGAVLIDVSEPEVRPGEVLVETAYSAISSGTELWYIRGSADPGFDAREYPEDPPRWPKIRSDVRLHHPLPRAAPDGLPGRGYLSIGYSLAGRVVAVGADVVDIKPGDEVACSGSQCAHHAELVAVPRNLVAKVPSGVPLEDAAFVTLGAISVAALREAACQFGESVVVYGLGLLGLLVGQIATAVGYRVIGLEVDAARLALARQLGLETLLDPGHVDTPAHVQRLTDGYGADAVILAVATDSDEPLNLSFDLCRQRARVVALGLFGWNIDRARMFVNEVSLHPVHAYGPGRYDPVYEEGNVDYPIGWVRWTENRNQAYFLELLAQRRVIVGPLAPIHVPFDRAPEAYELLQRADRPPTVVLRYR